VSSFPSLHKLHKRGKGMGPSLPYSDCAQQKRALRDRHLSQDVGPEPWQVSFKGTRCLLPQICLLLIRQDFGRNPFPRLARPCRDSR
jgi:hypothetical protein